MSQKGIVALVTGAATGIGKVMVENLLSEEANVAFCDIDKVAGEKAFNDFSVKYGSKVKFLHCDVTNDEQLEGCFLATINHFSKLDLVINNAGTINEEDHAWRNVIKINLIAMVQGSKLAMKYMSKEFGGKGGIIVNIGSITMQEPWPWAPVYSATKAAVNQFSRSLGSDLYFKKSGVKVLTINPGWTETSVRNPTYDEEILASLRKYLNCLGKQRPETIGKGLIEILRIGKNGSLWTIENERPPIPTTERKIEYKLD